MPPNQDGAAQYPFMQGAMVTHISEQQSVTPHVTAISGKTTPARTPLLLCNTYAAIICYYWLEVVSL